MRTHNITKRANFFGTSLREAREKANKTTQEVADHLGNPRIGGAHISDMERGNRPPLADEQIRQVAKFLDADYTALAVAAATDESIREPPLHPTTDLHPATVTKVQCHSGRAASHLTTNSLALGHSRTDE